MNNDGKRVVGHPLPVSHGSFTLTDPKGKANNSFVTGESFGENMLRNIARLVCETRRSFDSWFTPRIETVCETANNVVNPDTALLFLAQPGHGAQAMQQSH